MKKLNICLYVALFALSTNALSITFSVTEIGNYTIAGLNNSGQVVAHTTDGPTRVGIWQNGSFQEIGLTGNMAPSFEQQRAKGINNSGQVIFQEISSSQSYIWDSGSFTNVGNLPTTGPNSFGTEALGINDLGHVVGQSWTGPQDGYHAFLRTTNIQDICGSVGTGGGTAVAISNSGLIAGSGCNGSSESFMYENGSFTRLTDFGVTDINSNAEMAGQTASISGNLPAIWTDAGLNILSTSSGEATAINKSGQVVGTFGGSNAAFFWDEALGILDLNDLIDPMLGVSFSRAVDINDLGQIIVNGQDTSYLLTPVVVPVPAAVWLFGSGLLGLIGVAKRKGLSSEHDII